MEEWAPGLCPSGSCPRIEVRNADADRRADLVIFARTSDHHLERVRVFTSTGWRFATEARSWHELDCRGVGCRAADVDGDGELDVVDPIAATDAENASVDRMRGDVNVALGSDLWTDPVGPRKPVFSMPFCAPQAEW
jgi:hypothetical protein